MNDALRHKIAASVDLPPDTAADPEVVHALEHDPEAAAYARGIRAIDKALRAWPAPERTHAAWDEARARIEARLDADLASRPKDFTGRGVSATDDCTAPPVFDEPSPPMETHEAMSEPNENDTDLESLAALTRVSAVPAKLKSLPPRPALAPLTDAVDESSSGIVNIKHLARVARETPAAAPPTEAEPAAKEPAVAKEAAKEPPAKEPATKPTASKNNDVMVTTRPAVTAVVAPTPPPARGGAMWGLIAGIAVSAGAFALYINNQHSTALPEAPPSGAAAVAPATPSTAEAPVAAPQANTQRPTDQTAAAAQAAPPGAPEGIHFETAPSTVGGTPPVIAAAPTATPTPAPVVAVAAPVTATAQTTRMATATPTPAPTGMLHAHAAAHHGGAAGDNAEVSAAHAAPPVAEHRAVPDPGLTPTPTVPAAHVATAAPTAPAPAAAGGGNRSIDDLLAAAAPTRAAPAAAPAEAAPTTAPERLTRPQVFAVMNPLAIGARACTQGQTGTAPVAITIASDGSVQSANVSGQFSGTPAGDCIANLVSHRAHFPAIHQATQTFVFPFVITPPR